MYSELVKFTKTGQYGCGPDDEDDVYTVTEFRNLCQRGSFIDYDGFGHPVRNNLADAEVVIKPSRVDEIPETATHVVWYNR